jgi:hypothetical protein
LYLRVAAKHPDHKAVAIGHAMRKLLHLVFAVWRTGRPFDPDHQAKKAAPSSDSEMTIQEPDGAAQGEDQAAGHKPETEPAEKVVPAACAETVASGQQAGERIFIDFAHLKSQLSLGRVLDQLGLLSRLRGSTEQRRCACPIHRGDGRGRTFSVNLSEGVFCCFDSRCGKQGDVIDLWAALKQMSLREAALDLINTFDLEAAPAKRTEKRHG